MLIGGNASSTNGDSNNIVCEDNTSKEYEKQIQDDVNNGKEKTELDKGITATTDKTPKPDETKKDESTKIDVSDKNNKIEVVPSGDKPNEVPKPLPDNEQPKEDAKIPNNNELDDMNNATVPEVNDKKEETNNKPTNTPKPSDTENKPNSDKQDNSIKSDSDSKPNDKVDGETTQTTKTPVTISCLSGNSAIAGDSVQFKVTGDVKSVEGLDGLNHTPITNGYITVYTTPGVATVITPVVVGADGASTATTSVTISVVN